MWKFFSIVSLAYGIIYMLYCIANDYPLDINHDWKAFAALIVGFFFGAMAMRKESKRK